MRATRNWILACFILAFLVIIAGAVVRTTQSGMGCPDWPRCFGKWIPPLNVSELPPDFEKYLRKQDIDHSFNALHTWIEYFNRLLGALLGVFAIIQTWLLFPKRNLMQKSWRLACWFLFIVILTGLFGALVVKFNLAHASISVHLFFAILLIQVQLALLLSVHSKLSVLDVDPKMRNLINILLAVILIQSVMGTMVRMHVDDISKSLDYKQREMWLTNSPVVFLVHRSFSWFVFLLSIFIASKGRNSIHVKNKLFFLAGTIMLSMLTGIVLFYADVPAAAQPIHLLLAACAVTQCVSILLQAKKAVSQSDAATNK